ncbi:ParB/RepB/Spo0J family partition protein [Variovorax paradoxus]|uniref:ParB domain protein nuclease n=1 Tax=Variovorax paradoxus (strain EPS) TaxID=595537 RepID=E6V736_VARPE|nr:ParB/RepB/Spo0J family partition protein [Variovorax paradoxus]ADU38332.1 ParB domain protein nuclease [Variovorax paradoxus EPS]
MNIQESLPLDSKVQSAAELLTLPAQQLVPNPQNPRVLFDPEPLRDLKQNIALHGVLVPLTVFRLPDGKRFGILDGARRHRCCSELLEEGIAIEIPCNIVVPPNKLAGLLYMFNIHNFREAWELMPTALSLSIVIEELGETDTKKLSNLTGLSEPQVERCKLLLNVDDDLRQLSLDPNPKTRIPSNFWIEAIPIVELTRIELPDLYESMGERGILERFVEKYRRKKIKSVIHFRRIAEAFTNVEDDPVGKDQAATLLRRYINEIDLETRAAFDAFVQDARKVKGALEACSTFVNALGRINVEHVTDQRPELVEALKSAKTYIDGLLNKLSGEDDPTLFDDSDEDGDEE